MENKALVAFDKEFSVLNKKLAPLEWASPRSNLGYALVSLGQKESDGVFLKKSIAEMEDALEALNPKDALDDWIALQMTYAAALHALGQRDTGETVSLLNKSMEAYKKILPVLKRQEAPLEWALMMHNIAMVFQDLGEHSEGSRTLERSITAYNNALTQRSANVVPLQWALSQNNAAVALQVLGEIQQDTKILEDAVVSYGNACHKLTQSKHAVAWVITTGNLGSVRTILAEKTQDAEMARQAVNNLTEIVDFFRESTNPDYLKLAEQFKNQAEAVLQKVAG
jgi:tetratricopeptide (TPR) repeat protein